MSLEQKAQPSYSVSDYEEMFFGAIVSGKIDGGYLHRIKKEAVVTKGGQLLFPILTELQDKNGWVDYLSVLTGLSRHISSNDSKIYLERLTNKVPNEFNPLKAIELLENSLIRRTISAELDNAKQITNENPQAAPELLFAIYEKIDSILESKVEFNVGEHFNETVENIIGGIDDKIVVKTGLKAIDEKVGGLSRGEITIIGARPGHGKTSLAVNLPLMILKTNPKAVVVVFQLEMSMEQVKRKFLGSVSQVSTYRMRINQLIEGDTEKLKEGAKKMSEYQGRFFLYDNVFDLYAMNKIARSVKADVVLVDFITLMDDADESALRLSLSKIMKTSKRFAKAHSMSWIYFSQLNRGQEFREDHLPVSSDLAESDYLSQLAAEIMLLYYPFKYTFLEGDRKKLKIIYDKARYAGVNDTNVYFDADMCIIRDGAMATPTVNNMLKSIKK